MLPLPLCLLRSLPVTLLLLATIPTPALAQRVDENATAQAEDAFGVNISGQNLGLYSPFDVRGFSPTAAGNVRLDGLYFDSQAQFTSRLVGGYRILVGPSVLGHPFPAPSGIADYAIRRPGTRDLVSVSGQVDGSGGHLLEIDGQIHDVVPGLGFSGGVGLYHYGYGRGGGNDTMSNAVTAVWRPTEKIELIPFFSRIANRNGTNEPVVVLASPALPPPLKTHRFLGQRWAAGRDTALNYGGIGRVELGPWRVRAALFRSQDASPIAFTPLLLDTQPNGLANGTVIVERGAFTGATSGDLQVSRTITDGPRRHRVYLAAWGRDQRRRYGAIDQVELPSGPIDIPRPVPRPMFQFGPQTFDRVQQITGGLAYEGRWDHVGTLDIGIQKTTYRKTVSTLGAVLPTSRDQPWLFNAAASFALAPALTAYAGVSRGLEESDVAPSIAVNRNQAPPAIRTRQVDAGVHWALAPHLSLIVDAFKIEKPYSGLDAKRLFRDLGAIRHRGVELSLAGSPLPSTSIVVGAVGLDAAVSGEEVVAGTIGRRPVGSTPMTLLASADYRLPQFRALSVDATVNYQGARVATVDDRLRLPARAMVDLGLRYRFSVGHTPASFRLQAANILDTFSWDIAGSGALQPRAPRQISARLTADI